MERAVSRTGKSLLAGAIGWGLSALFGDFTGVLAGITARLFMGGEHDQPIIIEGDYRRMEEVLGKASEVPRMLLPYYG